MPIQKGAGLFSLLASAAFQKEVKFFATLSVIEAAKERLMIFPKRTAWSPQSILCKSPIILPKDDGGRFICDWSFNELSFFLASKS